MNAESTDDTILQGHWAWEEMRTHRREVLSNEQMEELIDKLCEHLSI